jgi:hypothetical protein
MRAEGRPFRFDKNNLDRFAEHARGKNVERLASERHGWNLISVGTRLYQIAPFIPDRSLRRKWHQFAESFFRAAKRRGEPKAKERLLAARPMDLPAFFRVTVGLLEHAAMTRDVQSRHSALVVAGALGILLFYPLRRADLLRLRWGRELRRDETGWLLAIDFTQKSGTIVEPLRLPAEATRFLDTCLLGGLRPDGMARALWRSRGKAVLRSRLRDAPYNADAFSSAFRRLTGHGPHILRSVWCDELVARGADRQVIASMLQHRSLISQKEYEVLATKLRRIQAVSALAELEAAALAR